MLMGIIQYFLSNNGFLITLIPQRLNLQSSYPLLRPLPRPPKGPGDFIRRISNLAHKCRRPHSNRYGSISPPAGF